MSLTCGVVAQEEDGSLGEGPLQVDVADLGAPGPELLACGAVVALHEPRVREEVLHPLEASDVVNLIEDRQGQDLSDAGNRAESVVDLRVVLLGAPFEMELELPDDAVVVRDQQEVDLHALAGIGILERFSNALAVGLVRDLGGRDGKVVLVVGILDVRQKVPSSANEMKAPAQ